MAKRSGRRDSRESGSGSHPIPQPDKILQALQRHGVPVGADSLAELLGLRTDPHRAALRRRLQQMVSRGQLLRNRKGEFCLLEKIDAVAGRVSAHADGFGFLIPDDGGDDIYLSFQEMRPLLNGDRVAVRVAGSGRGGRRAGELVDILARGKTSVVGRYERQHGVGFVLESGRSPHRFIVPDHHRGGARDGQLVKLEIIEYPDRHREAQGKVVRVLGESSDPGMQTAIAIEQFGLPADWGRGVEDEADAWGSRVRAADKAGRTDLRDTPLVTIDGADARDFDDAVYAEPAGDGWRLLVAIADVSHYVPIGGAVDREARRRGTSVYFADRVIPMLPETLSNGLCSLNPAVDRLCMVCEMRLGPDGKVARAHFFRGVMRSAARLTYEEVDEFHKTGKGRPALHKVGEQITNLYQAFHAFAAARRRRGALDLDLPEVRIELDEDGSIRGIAPRPRNDAHRLIEEFMVAANVQAAKFLRRQKLPALYRVHPGPGEEKFEELRVLLQELGIKVPEQARTDPRHLNQALQAIAQRPDSAQLSMSVLRSLSQAVYQPANIGHFGLALDAYAHFTSPIRRYPDLLVHRGIGHALDKLSPGSFAYDPAAMEQEGRRCSEQEGRRCSEQERRADEATRYVEARLKAAFLLDRIGEVRPGTVTGVTHFGLFVTLDELYVDGLIHVTSLANDYYHVTHGGLRLSGERTGASFGLGDKVSVRILRVDTDEAKVDLAMVSESDGDNSARQSRPGRRRRRSARG